MSKELPFLIYCIETYRFHKNLSGEDVMKLFNRYCVCQYIMEFYESLHTNGGKYIVSDIDEYIASRKVG